MNNTFRCVSLTASLILFNFLIAPAQNTYVAKYENSGVFAGIEVGSKGVKMSLLEIDKNARQTGSFSIIKDTTINTDFISFTQSTYLSTVGALNTLYDVAVKDYKIPTGNIFTAISSGVNIQAEKENKLNWIDQLINAFRFNFNEPERKVTVIDVKEEARLSHLGIVPDSRRYNTFLIDIGSGNTKGGYFPNGNTKDFKLFQLSWGTKSVSNTAEKKMESDNSMDNYNRQLARVLSGAENTEIIYAVNESGSFPMSDNVAFSGGIAWSLATLMFPELIENSVVPVTYEEVLGFSEKLAHNYSTMSDYYLIKAMGDKSLDMNVINRETKRVKQVFDQRSLMAGTGLLLKIMRQFESINERKNFYLVKNGSVGWISAYVNQNTLK
ncbi:MAG: hypothetical protein KTQ13_08800 [Ferruginibacter sp.]|nr:hypothetical protein [Chitinophagaceae bacterium]MBP6287337.1 hypothetical protein [Ferruginibacter sp.]MBU9936736.1 hypothetical protein [Ferruginibacter sp.]